MIRDAWLLGDRFVAGIWPTVIATKNKAHSQNSPLPYLFEKYNILPIYPKSSSLNRSVLGRIYNEFIEGLNQNDWLPKYIFVLPDKDLVEASQHYGFGCKIVFSKILTWMANNMEATIETRIDDLTGKRSWAFIENSTVL